MSSAAGSNPAGDPPGPTENPRPEGQRGARAVDWLLFGGLVLAVVVADQLAKTWIVANLLPGDTIRLIGDELRLIITHNTGGLFGLFRDQAAIFAACSVAVMGLILVFRIRSGPGLYLSLTLGLLLGGAVGNFIDRVRLGYVVDFVDGGLGDLRFYTFNVADMAVTASLLLLLALSLRPTLAGGRAGDHGR